LRDKDLSLARKKAHSIRGAALNLQLIEIAAAAERMERHIEDLGDDEVRHLLSTLSQGLDEVTKFLDGLE